LNLSGEPFVPALLFVCVSMMTSVPCTGLYLQRYRVLSVAFRVPPFSQGSLLPTDLLVIAYPALFARTTGAAILALFWTTGPPLHRVCAFHLGFLEAAVLYDSFPDPLSSDFSLGCAITSMISDGECIPCVPSRSLPLIAEKPTPGRSAP